MGHIITKPMLVLSVTSVCCTAVTPGSLKDFVTVDLNVRTSLCGAIHFNLFPLSKHYVITRLSLTLWRAGAIRSWYVSETYTNAITTVKNYVHMSMYIYNHYNQLHCISFIFLIDEFQLTHAAFWEQVD